MKSTEGSPIISLTDRQIKKRHIWYNNRTQLLADLLAAQKKVLKWIGMKKRYGGKRKRVAKKEEELDPEIDYFQKIVEQRMQQKSNQPEKEQNAEHVSSKTLPESGKSDETPGVSLSLDQSQLDSSQVESVANDTVDNSQNQTDVCSQVQFKYQGII